MIKLEEEQQKFSNQTQNLCQLTSNVCSKKFQIPSKQCYYRYVSNPKSVTVVCTQQEINNKHCSIRYINNKIQTDQSSQYTQYTKEFYINQFIKNIYNQNWVLDQQLNSHCTINNIQYRCIKKEEGTHQSSLLQTKMISSQDYLTSQDLLNTMTDYLQSIKPRFLDIFSSYSDEAIMLKVKEGSQSSLDAFVNQIFQKFYTAAIIKFFYESKQINRSKNEGRNIMKAKSQSEYHNFKNSFMNIITQLVCPQILDCFDLSQYTKNSLIETVERLREISVKFRPLKGKYHYYSNIHYNLLFFNYYETSYQHLKRSSIIQDLHFKVFKLDTQEFQKVNFNEIIKANHLKYLFGQIIIKCLEIAESQFSGNSNNISNISQSDYLKSRYFYIGKVKKGIQKLLKGKKANRF